MQPGQKLGPFVIEREIGAGAMGAVYRAIHTTANQHVAIKVMAPGVGSSETALERFKREADILKQLRHPNIVRLLATGRFKNAPFYAMEFVEGESLDKVLAIHERLTWEKLVDLGQQLCAALQHAHDQGIVHRDLKPSNVMILADGTVKLTDFGIAKDLDQTNLTATNCTVGTAAYMSPEQCRGERDIGPRSDLYSLGVMFYELITGKKPFEAESTMDMFLQHVSGKFVRPSKLVIDIPVWLDTLICQLLEKKPETRPWSAAAVAEALGQIKEKVEAQLSAGVAAASARAVDRPKGQKLNEEDREAARALLGKKKKKKKKPPFYTKNWFIGLALGTLVVTLFFFLYTVFLRVPTIEELHAQVAPVMRTSDLDSWREVRREPLELFLRQYASSMEKLPAEQKRLADDLHRWVEQVDCAVCERQMLNRRSGKFKPADDLERLANDALDEEDAGNLAEAKKLWGQLAQNRSEKDGDRHSWGLVGEKYRTTLDELILDRNKSFANKLWRDISLDRGGERKGDSPEEALAIKAIRAEQANKLPEARQHWEDLKRRADDDTRRTWFLMAAYKVRELKEVK